MISLISICRIFQAGGKDRLSHILPGLASLVIWPDGSLGCARPGETCTQAPVDGYWVVLKAGDRQFDFRASAKGEIRRCDYAHRLRMPVG